jgi:hypothetical protein
MNDVGEPCAGEPHARFDRGPLAKRNEPCGGRWSRAGALQHATTTARSGPQPQQRTAEPAAYLTSIAAHGYEGQYIVVVPDRELVVAHLGKTDAAVRPALIAQLHELVRAC